MSDHTGLLALQCEEQGLQGGLPIIFRWAYKIWFRVSCPRVQLSAVVLSNHTGVQRTVYVYSRCGEGVSPPYSGKGLWPLTLNPNN